MGWSRTSDLTLIGVRSNQLSYSPVRPTTLAVVVAIDDPFVGATDFRIGTRLGVGWGRKMLVCCAGLRSDGRFRHNLIGGRLDSLNARLTGQRGRRHHTRLRLTGIDDTIQQPAAGTKSLRAGTSGLLRRR